MIEDKLCAYEFCRKPFTPLKRWQIYCSRSCTNAAYYHRRAKKTALDLLAEETSNEPSEAQIADRERRIKESLLQREMDEELEKLVKGRHADELMRRGQRQESGLQDIGYGVDPLTDPNRPAYPKQAKEREDAAKAQQSQIDNVGQVNDAGGDADVAGAESDAPKHEPGQDSSEKSAR